MLTGVLPAAPPLSPPVSTSFLSLFNVLMSQAPSPQASGAAPATPPGNTAPEGSQTNVSSKQIADALIRAMLGEGAGATPSGTSATVHNANPALPATLTTVPPVAGGTPVLAPSPDAANALNGQGSAGTPSRKQQSNNKTIPRNALTLPVAALPLIPVIPAVPSALDSGIPAATPANASQTLGASQAPVQGPASSPGAAPPGSSAAGTITAGISTGVTGPPAAPDSQSTSSGVAILPDSAAPAAASSATELAFGVHLTPSDSPGSASGTAAGGVSAAAAGIVSAAASGIVSAAASGMETPVLSSFPTGAPGATASAPPLASSIADRPSNTAGSAAPATQQIPAVPQSRPAATFVQAASRGESAEPRRQGLGSGIQVPRHLPGFSCGKPRRTGDAGPRGPN